MSEDSELRAAVDVALVLADDAARRREYDHALAYLDAADDLTGPEPEPSLAVKRAIWSDALAAKGGRRIPLPALDDTWEEYAFIATDNGFKWRRIPHEEPGAAASFPRR